MERDDKGAKIEKLTKYIILAFCAVVALGLTYYVSSQPTDADTAVLCNKLTLEQSMLTRDIAAFQVAANQIDMQYNMYHARIKAYDDMPNGHWARQHGSAMGWMDNTSAQFDQAKRYFEEAMAANRQMQAEKCQKN